MKLRPETRALHNSPIDPDSGAIVPPIVLSTTFQYETTGREHDEDELIYTRYQNPNRAALESTPFAVGRRRCRACSRQRGLSPC